MRTLISVNGTVSAPEAAVIPILDRGFLFGDSVYEVLLWHRGAPVQLDEHMARLRHSAARLYLPLQAGEQALVEAMCDAVAAAEVGVDDAAYVRLIVTRGVGALGLAMSEDLQQNVIVIVAPARCADEAAFERGLHMAIVDRRRVSRDALDPGAKTGNYMNNALALHEAHLAGADDAILLNANGDVTEATTANVYAVRDGVLITPALDAGLLEGTTRRRILRLAREAGRAVEERAIRAEELRAADEVFVSSSIRGLVPVVSIDGEAIGGGRPGPVARTTRAALAEAADADARAWHAMRSTPGS